MKHVVKAGENPAIIADMYTGDPWRFSELIAQNPQIPTEVVHLGTVGAPAVRTFSSEAFVEGTTLNLPDSWACQNCGEVHANGTVGAFTPLRVSHKIHLPTIYTWDSIVPGKNYAYIEAYFFGVESTRQLLPNQYPKSYVQQRIRDTFMSPADAIVKYNQGGLAVYPSAGPNGGPYVPANADSSIQSMKFWNFILSEIRLGAAYEGATSMQDAMQGIGLTGAAKGNVKASNAVMPTRKPTGVPWGTLEGAPRDSVFDMDFIATATWDTPHPLNKMSVAEITSIMIYQELKDSILTYGWSTPELRKLGMQWLKSTWTTPKQMFDTAYSEKRAAFLFTAWFLGWDLQFSGSVATPCSAKWVQQEDGTHVPVQTGYIWDPTQRKCVKAGQQTYPNAKPSSTLPRTPSKG